MALWLALLINVNGMDLLLPTATFPKFRLALLADNVPAATGVGVDVLPTFVPLHPIRNMPIKTTKAPQPAYRKGPRLFLELFLEVMQTCSF